jgi:MFS family permease
MQYSLSHRTKILVFSGVHMNEVSEKALKSSRRFYIVEAALEYFISILVAGSYLATLTKELGISDSLTGVLSAIISLGCLFQLLSMFVRRTQVKSFVIVFSIINQLLFMLLYVIPLTNFKSQTKVVIFIAVIFTAYLIYNFIHPKKVNWLMSLVENKNRGKFTASKEIVSLLSGIFFSFGMGTVLDYFSEKGEIRISFTISAIVIFVLMVLHALTMIFSVEKPSPKTTTQGFKQTIRDLITNKNILRVSVVFILYYIANYSSVPFYGSYQISELGLNLKFVSAITICGSVSRICVSKFWGRYADKKSFAAMIEKCFFFLLFSQLCVILAVPTVGKIMFVLYNILHGIALGGINSALTNLIFDYAPSEKRADSLAITQALAGLTGFLTTLFVSPLVSYIQSNGNTIFGLPIYAQQFITIISLLFTVVAIFYTRFTFIKSKKA